MKKIFILLTVAFSFTSMAENSNSKFKQSYIQKCAENIQAFEGIKVDSGDFCACVADVIESDINDKELALYELGNYNALSGVMDRTRTKIEHCEKSAPKTKPKASKASAQLYQRATCKHWIGSTYHTCKKTITGGHAWCFTGNDNLNPGDVLCKDAPTETSCSKDTVQFGIIPTLLPKDICTFK